MACLRWQLRIKHINPFWKRLVAKSGENQYEVTGQSSVKYSEIIIWRADHHPSRPRCQKQILVSFDRNCRVTLFRLWLKERSVVSVECCCLCCVVVPPQSILCRICSVIVTAVCYLGCILTLPISACFVLKVPLCHVSFILILVDNV